ncbi:MAG: hypothetical protein ACPGU9_00385 [Flavobacteriaceae bacterium]
MKNHSFHIPVMGIGFTIDTPLKISKYGMDSVISLVDDMLMEKLRKMYCGKYEIPYQEITEKIVDFRAKRITSYLNMIHGLAEQKFEEFKATTLENTHGIKQYLNMLPNSSNLKKEFLHKSKSFLNKNDLNNWFKTNLSMGSIDVNIMTKLDKENFQNKKQLPTEFNDAHAALRGYANSQLASSIVLSAGMNPRLYTYMEQFKDFYPDANGYIKKKIILKVSDYRSALIQGKFLAKKGLWVSEYRIESGLNCGGHAFATDGYLLGPVLEEFKTNRTELNITVQNLLTQALKNKNKLLPKNNLTFDITAQGGVGTAEEHQFLLNHYKIDSVGWGSPFLLVPEATTVDDNTLEKLIAAKEEDIYLSDISPLGVPFNNLKGNTKDLEKELNIQKGRPGSSCPRKLVLLNKEFKNTGLCTASREYQYLKLKELDAKELDTKSHQIEYDKITEKSCTCVGLGTTALIKHNIDTKSEGRGVSACPGPNLAYFSKKMSLQDMTNHIYGKSNVISHTDRPHMFIKELSIYIDYLKQQIESTKQAITVKQEKYFHKFIKNLNTGITYYHNLFNNQLSDFKTSKEKLIADLKLYQHSLQQLETVLIRYNN